MSYRCVLCASVAGVMAAGCFETSRNPWMQQTTLVSERPLRSANMDTGKKREKAAEAKPRAGGRGECGLPQECASLLKTMLRDPARRWMRQRASFTAYANGTRLFAYRSLRTKLDCDELGMALGEIEAAAQSLANPPRGIPVEQVIRIRTLNTEVGDELRAEEASRCARGTRVLKG
jgi:hypothetical protein